MIEKVLNETSVTPKITLTQTEYNRLVELAQANAKQIDERDHAVIVRGYQKERYI